MTQIFSGLLLLATLSATYELKEPVRNTVYGQVRGKMLLSRNQRYYEAYRGIPYAKPPVGPLRFKAPEEPDAWEFPMDATKDGPMCIQKNVFFHINPPVEGKEDCLYLNVYTPVSSSNTTAFLPVMVFIHWGGFIASSGRSDIIGPEYIMDTDIILVTFNYRLAVMGLLSTLDDASPGNYLQKDQVLALKWVQNNIVYFGGNKNLVTIFGQSAGGGLVHYLLLSPSSRGLFHRAISQSGSALALWAKPFNILQPTVVAAQATFVGCGEFIGDNHKLVDCLRGVDAATLVGSIDMFRYLPGDPLNVYTTVIEEKTDANPNPFFTKEPLEYIKAGEFANIPWMVGLVQDEGILKAAPLIRQSDTRNKINADFDATVTKLLGLELSVGNNSQNLLDDIKKQYLLDQSYIDVGNSKNVQGFIDVYTDRTFAYGTYQSVMLESAMGHKPIWFYTFDYRGKNTYGDLFGATNETVDYNWDRVFNYGSYQSMMLHSAAGHRPVWFYNFNYKGQYTFGDKFAATDENIYFNWGVSHCDDLLYLFKTPALFPDELNEENDIKMINKIVKIWTDFATYGDPDPSKSLCWNQLNINGLNDMKNEKLCYLNINGTYQTGASYGTKCGYIAERMRFWSSRPLSENFPGLE